MNQAGRGAWPAWATPYPPTRPPPTPSREPGRSPRHAPRRVVEHRISRRHPQPPRFRVTSPHRHHPPSPPPTPCHQGCCDDPVPPGCSICAFCFVSRSNSTGVPSRRGRFPGGFPRFPATLEDGRRLITSGRRSENRMTVTPTRLPRRPELTIRAPRDQITDQCATPVNSVDPVGPHRQSASRPVKKNPAEDKTGFQVRFTSGAKPWTGPGGVGRLAAVLSRLVSVPIGSFVLCTTPGQR
jgi:hypothetical protein